MQKKLLLFVCLLISFLIVNSQFSVVHAPYIGENCVLYLPMNEGSGTITYDQSTYKNNGTLLPVGSEPTWVDSKSPAYGKALSFDGINDYVLVTDKANLNPSSITISAWFKPTTDWYQGIGTNPSILDKYDGGGYILFFENSMGTLSFVPTAGGFARSTARTWVAGIWYFVVATLSAGVESDIYINGVPEGSAYGVTLLSNSYDITIGRFRLTSDTFKGVIDEVRIYNRTLTQAEITVLYNAGFTSAQSETFSYSDSMTMTQEQKYSLSETMTTTTILTYGLEFPVTFLEVFNSETLHITDTIRIWQEQRYIFPSTITFNESPTFQNFVLEIYTYINEVLAIAAIAFILAVVALSLVLVSQRQKD